MERKKEINKEKLEEELTTGSENEETDARGDNLQPSNSSLVTSQFIPNPISKQRRIKDPKTISPGTKIVYVLPKYASTYELEKFEKNLMIIINNDEFQEGDPRPGSLVDEAKLIETFSKYRFKIDGTYYNLNRKRLLNKVKKFALDTDFSSNGCVCVAILTHGNKKEPGELKAKDKWYSELDIFKFFDASKNHTLAAKPIIFIIQACRGPYTSSKVIVGEKTPASQLDNGVELEKYHLPTDCDRIIFHSCYIGKAAVRDPKHGSWFIQKLCEKVQEFGLTHDLETIFKKVRHAVAVECVSIEDWKQMPVVTSTTLRDLQLVPTLQENTQQSRASSSARPCSPAVSRSQINNPDALLSHQLEELQVSLGKSTETSVPDCSPVEMMLQHRPCCCFLEYFEYLKDCLEGFVDHNPEDSVAEFLLEMTKKVGNGAEYNVHKFDYIQAVWKHFEANIDKFPSGSTKFLHPKFSVRKMELN